MKSGLDSRSVGVCVLLIFSWSCTEATTSDGGADGGAPVVDRGAPGDLDAGGASDGAASDAQRVFIFDEGLRQDGAQGGDAEGACPPDQRAYRDEDGDGFGGVDLGAICPPPPGAVAFGGDCDDQNPEIGPDEVELCDGVDNDCDGLIDNHPIDARAFYLDEDGDGVGGLRDIVIACEAPPGYAEEVGDCNDADPAIGECALGAFCSASGVCLEEGACVTREDCPRATICEAGACVPGGLCGGQEYDAARVAPNLLLVLDRSCSMRDRVEGVRKWQSAVSSIVAITQAYEGQIRFGLTLFPDRVDPRCEQDAIPFPVGPGNEAGIQALLEAALDNSDENWPDGPCVTNIRNAILQAGGDPGLRDPARRSFIMLITDGRQMNCGNASARDEESREALAGLSAEAINTFVVGFGGAVSVDDLDQFAEAGGVPREAPEGEALYYQANNEQELLESLDAISSAVLGCEFALDEIPPDLSDLHVFFDGQELARDVNHLGGWDYVAEGNMVAFYGEACAQIMEQGVEGVSVVFGCTEGG